MEELQIEERYKDAMFSAFMECKPDDVQAMIGCKAMMVAINDVLAIIRRIAAE